MLSKLVCRSHSRTAVITNIDFRVQTNFPIQAHIFAAYSCPRLHFIDPTNILIIRILKYTSSNFDSFIIFSNYQVKVSSLLHTIYNKKKIYLAALLYRTTELEEIVVIFFYLKHIYFMKNIALSFWKMCFVHTSRRIFFIEQINVEAIKYLSVKCVVIDVLFKFKWNNYYCLFSGRQHACAHTIICANSARVYSIMINIVNNTQ